MMPSQSLTQMQVLPKLRQELSSQFQHHRRQSHQSHPIQRNFILRLLLVGKNTVQNIVAFCFTFIFLIPLWMFKIGLKVMDLVQRGIRFVVWLNIKGLISWINFLYRVLTFFRLTKVIKIFQNIAKKYFRKYSTSVVDNQDQNVSRLSLIMKKKQHDLIDIQKIQHRIKTPNIFIKHDQKKKQKKRNTEEERQQYRERINKDLVPQRRVQENIVEVPQRLKSPKLLNVAESHARLKRNATSPTPLSERRQFDNIQRPTVVVSQGRRLSPDRDISPQRYRKQIPPIEQFNFKKKQSPEQQILMTHHNPYISGTEAQKQQLQHQLGTLRAKMSQLITNNNRDIEQLQEWIRQKSQTIMQTRRQNLELLQEIQELQKENVIKTQKFIELEERVKTMQKILEQEKYEKNGLNQQIQQLQEQIKGKTIEIMTLKQKIKNNFQHLQQMESIFQTEKLAAEDKYKSFEQLAQNKIPHVQEQNVPSHTLRSDLKLTDQVPQSDIARQSNQTNQRNYSTMQNYGSAQDQQQLEQQLVPSQTQSQKQMIEHDTIKENDDKDQELSVKTNPLQIELEEHRVGLKIKDQERKMCDLTDQVQKVLKEEEKIVKEFQMQTPTIIERIQHEIKEIKSIIDEKNEGGQSNKQETKQQENKEVLGGKKKNKKKKNYSKVLKDDENSKITVTLQ